MFASVWTGKKSVSVVMGRILVLGFGAQILLGCVWAMAQFGHFQEFSESLRLQEVSQSLICDEYTGILYPLLIRVSRGIGRVVPVPYFCMLYFLQLVVAFWAGWFLVGSFQKGRRLPVLGRIWAALSLVTMPMAMQCHMAVLPNSLCTSLFLVMLGLFWRGIHPEEGTGFRNAAAVGAIGDAAGDSVLTVVLLGILYLLLGLLMPEYRFLGCLPLVGYGIWAVVMGKGEDQKEEGQKEEGQTGEAQSSEGRGGERRNTGRILHVVLLAAFTAFFVFWGAKMENLTTREGAYGRMNRSLETAAFLRFAWDDFGQYYSDWPEDLVNALTQEEIRVGNSFPLQKEWILGKNVDAVYGTKRAREIYAQVAKVEARDRMSRNIKEIAKDLLCYGFAPAMQLWLMEGGGHVTLSGRNLDIMRAVHPKLTTAYVRYGSVWFVFGAVIAALLGLGGILVGEAQEKAQEKGDAVRLKKWVAKASALWWHGAVSLLITVWYTMQGGGIMDYKKSLPVTLLWGLWMCLAASCRAQEESGDLVMKSFPAAGEEKTEELK